MKVTRQSIIEARRNQKRQKLNKIWAFTAKAAFVLFTSAATLSHISTQTLEVSAQTTQKTRTDFLNLVGNYAREVARKNDLYASVMVAQAILESGWGQSSLAQAPNYNLFGIKGNYNGETVKMDTLEDDGSGNYYSTVEPFRKYSNYGESLADYASILTGDNDPNSWRYKFYYGARISQTTSYQDATKHLTGRYATDTRYGSKLNELIETYQLTQYDPESASKFRSIDEKQNPVVLENKVEESKTSEKLGNYTVNAGDSYWAISRKYGVSIAELQRLNGTSSLLIHPGQVLKVPATASETTQSSVQPKSSFINNVTEITPVTPATKEETSKPTVTLGNYTVNAGDSYWAISRKYGVSIAELQRLNGASTLLIHPGQVLRVPVTSSEVAQPPVSVVNNALETTPKEEITKPKVTVGAYTVNAGDSYWRIANKYGITIAELQRLNGATSLLIHPGQVLKVPGGHGTGTVTHTTTQEDSSVPVTSPSVATNVTPPSTGAGQYVVQAGESYGIIAARYGVTVEALQQMNGATSLLIHPGQVLRVPTSGISASQPSAPTTSPVVPNATPVSATSVTNATGQYTVQAGESYGIIAARYGVTVETLQQMNGATSLLIHPGQVLRVPVR